MLLETLDIKKNDIIIYSKNIFDLEKNFRIIDKDDITHTPRRISFENVCKSIEEFTPKNLVVYRVLTNIRNFEIGQWKYGFMIRIEGERELIYFDPIFAIKELEEYAAAMNSYDLRFRIQQVGLTTLNRLEGKINFAEIYSIDLEAKEAKYQNDKVFVDALYSVKKRSKPKETPVKTESADITEDMDYDPNKIKSIKHEGEGSKKKDKSNKGVSGKITFGEFITKKKLEINRKEDDKKIVLKLKGE